MKPTLAQEADKKIQKIKHKLANGQADKSLYCRTINLLDFLLAAGKYPILQPIYEDSDETVKRVILNLSKIKQPKKQFEYKPWILLIKRRFQLVKKFFEGEKQAESIVSCAKLVMNLGEKIKYEELYSFLDRMFEELKKVKNYSTKHKQLSNYLKCFGCICADAKNSKQAITFFKMAIIHLESYEVTPKNNVSIILLYQKISCLYGSLNRPKKAVTSLKKADKILSERQTWENKEMKKWCDQMLKFSLKNALGETENKKHSKIRKRFFSRISGGIWSFLRKYVFVCVGVE